MSQHVGNFAVIVHAYREHDNGHGDLTRTKVVDTPTFVMGGSFGQAMTKNDVIASLQYFWPNINSSNVYVGGNKVANGTDNHDLTYYVSVQPIDEV